MIRKMMEFHIETIVSRVCKYILHIYAISYIYMHVAIGIFYNKEYSKSIFPSISGPQFVSSPSSLDFMDLSW